MKAGHTMRGIGRPLPPDLVAESVGRYVDSCDSCSYPFDPSERLYWSESIGGAFCSKACAADGWERRLGRDVQSCGCLLDYRCGCELDGGKWYPIKD
jgi:hypothetical protein